jgi:hypothetical protein
MILKLYYDAEKGKNGYPYPTRIPSYLTGSPRSISDPNPKLQYSGITRIRPEYKNTRICIQKTGICTICIRYPTGISDPFSPLGNRLSRVPFLDYMVLLNVTVMVLSATRLSLMGLLPMHDQLVIEDKFDLHHHVDAEYVGIVERGSWSCRCSGPSLGLGDCNFSRPHPSRPSGSGDLGSILLLSDSGPDLGH